MESPFAVIRTREISIEGYLKQEVERHGGQCWKFVSPGRNGVPDRIVFLPGCGCIFVELKAPGKQLRKLQAFVHEQIKTFGCKIETLSTKEQVDGFIQRYVQHSQGTA